MEKNITISVDLMGGAGAPRVVLEAIALTYFKRSDLRFMLFGDEVVVKPLIDELRLPQDIFSLHHTNGVVLDNDKPIYALKYGKNSSMRMSIEAVKSGEASACVSCGNTGALMVMAKSVLGTLQGVRRPAIAGLFPHLYGRSVMLDMGANNECNEVVLFQFAVMGLCFAKVLLNDSPSIAILNIGKEEVKGRDLEQKTSELLRESGLNFIGYIEGDDITKGKADVIVTDGFSGNLVLKASEGAAHIFLNLIKQACHSGLTAKLGALLLKKSLKKSLSYLDPNMNNGAMFIGLNGIVIKSHGSANIEGVLNAILTASELAKRNINEAISAELNILEENGIGLNFVDKIKHTSAKILGL